MFNTMTITKAAGALIGALLFLLLANWAASGLYHVGPAGHGGGHGEDGELVQAYAIPVEDSGAAEPAEEAPQIDVAALMESADAAAGEREWGKCRACHKLDGTDGTGPHLDGIVGRPVGSVDGFAYSDGMASHGGDWTPELLITFLTNPRAEVPGTKMAFAGIRDPQAIAHLIAYLESQ